MATYQSEGLKPCPFCGCEKIEAATEMRGAYRHVWMRCHGCGVRTAHYIGHRSEPFRLQADAAAKIWNRRADDAPN